LKGEISKALASLSRYILIIIDDIDRLPFQEILEVIQIVNANADFPNLVSGKRGGVFRTGKKDVMILSDADISTTFSTLGWREDIPIVLGLFRRHGLAWPTPAQTVLVLVLRQRQNQTTSHDLRYDFADTAALHDRK
jgi:hypothetical protein